MLGSKVPVSNPQWQVLLLLFDCLDVIFAPIVTEGLVDMLTYLIEDHHAHFLSSFPSQKLLPKHHFLVHYPEFLMKFGPLSQYWCMRFEAKHRFGKELASTVRCFKNITYTIAKRTQMELAHSLLNNKLFISDSVVGNCTSVLVQSLEPALAQCLCEFSGLNTSDEVDVVSSGLIGHYHFKPGCCAVLRCLDGVPEFGEILLIVALGSSIFCCCGGVGNCLLS
jgi:hypothetical protein